MSVTIKEVIEKYGMTRKALLIYEEKGLIHPTRNMSGYREYDLKQIEIIGKICFLRKLEFSLNEIEDILMNHHYELFQEKKKEYDKDIHFIEMKKSYLDYANDVFNDQYSIDEAYKAVNDTIELYDTDEYNELIHFELQRESVGIMWLLTLIISFLSGKFSLIIMAFFSLFVPIILSLKSVRNFFLSIYARRRLAITLLLFGMFRSLFFWCQPNNMVNEFLFGMSLLLCFGSIASFHQVQKYFKKYQFFLSMIFFILSIGMFGFIFFIEINGKIGFGYIIIASFLLGIGVIFNQRIRQILGYILMGMI